ncbi:MAG: SRPBCC family protein [Myxococcota bacterium]
MATASDGAAPAAVLAGEIVVDRVDAPGDPVPTFRARAVVDAPPAVVWDLVSHCAGYATLMPRIISSQERKRIGDLVECEVTVELPFPLPNLTSVTTATHREGSTKGRYSRTWTLVSGDYEVNEGAWIIEPVDGGKRSLATYRVRAKPNLPVPASLASLFQQGPLVESMRAVRRAASQHPRPSSADGTSPPNQPP